jgi:hypothetical protein
MGKGWKVSINPKAKDILNGSANRAVAIAAEHVLRVAKEQTPIEEKTLMNSGAVSTDPDTFTAAVSFDTPYAVPVHENMHARHDSGKNAKFLENAMNSEVEAAAKIIADTIRGDI